MKIFRFASIHGRACFILEVTAWTGFYCTCIHIFTKYNLWSNNIFLKKSPVLVFTSLQKDKKNDRVLYLTTY
jgi:hypothetical protein